MRKTFYGVSGALTLFVCAFFAQSALSQAETVVIHEVGFKEEHDFIELKVHQNGNYGGYSVFEGGVKIAELPSRDYQVGELVLLQDDGVEPVNSTAAVFIDSIGGLTGTDNVIHIRDVSDSPIDAFLWSNDNGNFTGNKTVANQMVSLGLWLANDVFSSTYDNGAWIDSDSVSRGQSVHISPGLSQVKDATPGYERVANLPPVPFGERLSGTTLSDTFIFDASGSSDNEDDALTFEWMLDGEVIGVDKQLSYVFPAAGVYDLMLNVSDGVNEAQSMLIGVEVVSDVEAHDILISELFPNPKGKDTDGEFIELYNPNNHLVDISGYELRDSSKGFTIQSVVLGPFEYRSFPYSETGITLNNDSDVVTFSDVPGDTLMTVKYSDAQEGQAYALSSNEFFWTSSPTPSAQNEITKNDLLQETNDVHDTKTISNDSNSKEAAGGDDSEMQKAQSYRFVSISEFLPNPSGADADGEWIELYNYGSEIVDLRGWQIDDESGGSSSFDLTGKKIASGDRLVLSRSETGISLNNTQDSVRLIDPWGVEVDAVRYVHTPQTDSAFARNARGVWEWTSSPTPGTENVITAPQNKSKAKVQKKPDTKSKAYIALSIAEILKREKGDLVSLEGYIVVPPGIISKRMFIVEQDGSFIQVYKSKGDVPELSMGQKIALRGKVSVTQGETRVLLQESDDLAVLDGSKNVDPIDIISSGIRDEHFNQLVMFNAVLEKREGNELFFVTEAGVIRVYLSQGSEINSKRLTEGDQYTVVGVVRKRDEQLFVYPRFESDIRHQALDISNDRIDSGIEAHAAHQAAALGENTGLDMRIILIIAGTALLGAWIVYRFRSTRR